MLPDQVSNPGPLTYESGALPIALRGPAILQWNKYNTYFTPTLKASASTLPKSFVNSGPFFLLFCITSFAKYIKVNLLCGDTETIRILLNPIALGTAKTLWSFGCSECNRVKN